jgi:hypothetical protein
VRSHLVSLLQICDVFEALTAVRPYKPPLDPLEAFSIMIGDSGAFDPPLFKIFVSILGIYPPGNCVRLSDGSEGIVIAAGTSIDKPLVRITRDRVGKPLEEDPERILNMAAETSAGRTGIKLITEEPP